jgi:hypothetical protein
MSKLGTFNGLKAFAEAYANKGKPQPKLRQEKKRKRWEGASNTRRRNYLNRCIICGLRKGESQAIVKFSLHNGPCGEMAGRICADHQEGHSWRGGLGTVTTITVSGVRLVRDIDNPLMYDLPRCKALLEETRKAMAAREEQGKALLKLPSLAVEAFNALENWGPQGSKSMGSRLEVTMSTAGKALLALFKAGLATRQKTSKGFIYTVKAS